MANNRGRFLRAAILRRVRPSGMRELNGTSPDNGQTMAKDAGALAPSGMWVRCGLLVVTQEREKD